MSGIYIHIPFCKQACNYCDFHFVTSLKKKSEMISAIKQELIVRKTELVNTQIKTIYFGGGTPSVLTTAEINDIITTVYTNYNVTTNAEITLEANPDDLTPQRIIAISKSPVNRLSIGVQSFFEEDLLLMNRAHNAKEAEESIALATQHFSNISIDLIYGIPGLSNNRWRQNIKKALDFGLPHISSYALTVEPKTALAHQIKKGEIATPNDAQAQEQFNILVAELTKNNFVNYEISNFGKEGCFSKNNTAYWQGISYLGIGPSAHSFNGKQRSWNINNNVKYIKAITNGILPSETEILTNEDRYNEYVMTGLRTIWGVSIGKIESDFGAKFKTYLLKGAQKYIDDKLLLLENNVLKTTQKGKFMADGIAADLFLV